MLPINKISVSVSVHELAVANNVTDEQMAAYIFRNFYRSINELTIAAKIKRHAVAISNLTSEI